MKELITAKSVFVVLITIYCVSVTERRLNVEYNHSEEIVQHERDKATMQDNINSLTNKIYKYEIDRIKKNASVDTMSNDGLDSEWSDIHR